MTECLNPSLDPRPILCRAALALLLSMAVTAQAQTSGPPPSAASSSAEEPGSGGLAEIVVTAQRRQQTEQDVAISMDAYSSQQLEELGINNVQDLANNTPNVAFESYFGAGKPQISIRGISIGDLFTDFEQSPVGVYNDEVYVGSRSGQLSQMFDLDRLEVLRGPQGTLYGRNTTAGAIDFISKKPGDQFEADGSITYGRFNEIDFDGGVTLPVSDTLSIRVSGVKRQRDGWVFNVDPDASQKELDDIDNWGARALIEWKPNSDMSWLLNFHGNGNHTATPVIFGDLGTSGQNAPNIYTGYLGPSNWNQVASDFPTYERLNSHGTALTGTINFGELTLTTITDYDYVDYAESEDDDGSPYEVGSIANHSNTHQFSEELRLAAKQGPFDWVAGVYYYTDYLRQTYIENAFLDPIFLDSGYQEQSVNYPTQASHNYAGFGDLRYAVTDQWTLDLGARYTRETKHLHSDAYLLFPPSTAYVQSIGGPGEPDSNLNHSWSAPTGRAALEWKPTKDILAYGSYSRGFKSGGYNGLAFNTISELAPYNPEYDNSFELGVKTGWLEGRLTANADVFLNKLKNLQQLDVETVTGETYFFVRNAASGTTKGAEFEVRAAPGGGWNLSLGLGLLNTRYDAYVLPGGINYTGEEFTDAPKINADTLVQYAFGLLGGTLAPDVSYSYVGYRWTDNPHRPGIDTIPGYGLLGASIPWTTSNKRWEVSLWGRNLTNKHYYLQTIGDGVLAYGTALSYHADPRTYGVTLRFKLR
jgi:iron complex outermembrane recepter protein